MNLRRAGKGIVRKGKRPSVYRIGFNDGDETELTANGIWYREDWYLEDLEEAIRSTGLEVTQERVDKLLEECHRIFDDKSGRNEILAQKASCLRRSRKCLED